MANLLSCVGIVLDGRWAFNEVPRLTPAFCAAHGISEDESFYPHEADEWLRYAPAHISSPYGLLRGPWNYSPSIYALRYNSVMGIESAADIPLHLYRRYMGSTCAYYKNFIKQYVVGQPLVSYLINADALAHGPVHFTVGGGSIWTLF